MLNAIEIQKIEQAIRQVETQTSAEIVPMIVKRSCSVTHVPALLLATFIALFCTFEFVNAEVWNMALSPYLNLIFVLVAFVIIVILSRQPWVQRFLTPKSDRARYVEMRAFAEFYQNGIHRTSDARGVLIFLSLMERYAVILGDREIVARLPATTWNESIQKLLAKAREGDIASGLQQSIEHVGAILAQTFPATGHPKNQIANRVLIGD